MNLRNLLNHLNEAFAPIDVDSSHITSVAYINDKLYVTFYDGGIYEYDDTTEEEATQMMDASSKGKFMWAHIRQTKPYQKVNSIPDLPPEQSEVPAVNVDTIEVPLGHQFRAPDGDTYIWKGAQWVNTRTGRMAHSSVRDRITNIAKRLIKLKGEGAPAREPDMDPMI